MLNQVTLVGYMTASCVATVSYLAKMFLLKGVLKVCSIELIVTYFVNSILC